MPYTHLDLNKLGESEESINFVFNLVTRLRKKILTRQEVLRVYEEGITIQFVGDGFHSAPDLNYACFFVRASKSLPLIITARCCTSRSASHQEIIHADDIGNLIVAGIITNCRFTSFSSTWLSRVMKDSPPYFFGKYVNDLLLHVHKLTKSSLLSIPAQAYTAVP